jgi:hypothetical protein
MPATTFRILRPGEALDVPAGCTVTYVECRSSDGAVVLEVKAKADTRVVRQGDLVRYLPAGVVQ